MLVECSHRSITTCYSIDIRVYSISYNIMMLWHICAGNSWLTSGCPKQGDNPTGCIWSSALSLFHVVFYKCSQQTLHDSSLRARFVVHFVNMIYILTIHSHAVHIIAYYINQTVISQFDCILHTIFPFPAHALRHTRPQFSLCDYSQGNVIDLPGICQIIARKVRQRGSGWTIFSLSNMVDVL